MGSVWLFYRRRAHSPQKAPAAFAFDFHRFEQVPVILISRELKSLLVAHFSA